MIVVLCLFVGVSACFNGFLVSGGTLSLVTSPKEIDLYSSKPFTVNCTYEPDVTNTDDASLISIVLSRRPPTGARLPQELASIDGKSPLHVLDTSQSPGVKFSGIVQDKSLSHLSGTWDAMSTDLVGTYVCQANLMDNVGHILTTSRQANVLEQTNSLRTYLEEVRDMKKDLDVHQACCLNRSAQIAEFQAWRKSLALNVVFMQRNLLMNTPSSSHNGSRYYLSKYPVETQYQAEAVCETIGGYLAEVDDTDEWEFIKLELNRGSVRTVFIAGRDDVVDGQWYWPRTNMPVTFLDWLVGQPGRPGIYENCLEAYKTTDWFYNDTPCKKYPTDVFLCEVPDN